MAMAAAIADQPAAVARQSQPWQDAAYFINALNLSQASGSGSRYSNVDAWNVEARGIHNLAPVVAHILDTVVLAASVAVIDAEKSAIDGYMRWA
jgi:hypothetical protein